MTREVSRRSFLGRGMAVSLGLAATACGWDGGDRLVPTLRRVSRLNDWLGERLLSHDRQAPKYSHSERSRSFPNYHISRTTPILADPAARRLEVGGLVRHPLSLSRPDLEALDRLTYTVKHLCVEGWTAIATWTGTPFRVIADRAGVLPEARYVRFDSFDAGYFNGWDMKSALHPETILAYGFNDHFLTSEHGAPLRLYAPHKLGYKLTKYLTRVTFTAERPGGFWEDRGYPWFAGV
jgi:DMSO/TMAO reductase YedYZ molybdopterin-dependent catalytic subunit